MEWYPWKNDYHSARDKVKFRADCATRIDTRAGWRIVVYDRSRGDASLQPIPLLLSFVSHREILPCCLPPFFSRLFARNRKSWDQSNERWTTNVETIDSVVKRGDHRSVAPIIIGLRRGWNPPFMLDRRRRLEEARKNGRFYDRRTKLDFYLFIYFFLILLMRWI